MRRRDDGRNSWDAIVLTCQRKTSARAIQKGNKSTHILHDSVRLLLTTNQDRGNVPYEKRQRGKRPKRCTHKLAFRYDFTVDAYQPVWYEIYVLHFLTNLTLETKIFIYVKRRLTAGHINTTLFLNFLLKNLRTSWLKIIRKQSAKGRLFRLRKTYA